MYNVLIYAALQSESVIHTYIYIYILIHFLFHYGLSLDTEYSLMPISKVSFSLHES